MSVMTKVAGVPDTDQAIPGMAYFAGTGPLGAKCGGCKHRGYTRQSRRETWSEKLQQWVQKTYRVQSCAMFRKLSGGAHGPSLRKDCDACKYFEVRASRKKMQGDA